MNIDCTICNERITNTKDMSVARCGHIFHSKCLITFVKPKAIECPVCGVKISHSTILQIHPITLDDRQVYGQCSQGMTNADQSQSQENIVDEKQITKLHNYLKEKDCIIKKLERKNKQYSNEIKVLNVLKQTTLDEVLKVTNDSKKLSDENMKNTLYINELKATNDASCKQSQAYKIELESTKKDYVNATSRVDALHNNNIDLAQLNEQLIKENEEMKKDFITISKEMAEYDSAVSLLMLTELDESILHKNIKLSECKSLQEENEELKNKLCTLTNSQGSTKKRALHTNDKQTEALMEGTKKSK